MLYIEEDEFQDLECPHCRVILLSDEEFLEHVCPEDLPEDTLLMEDII